MPLGRVELADCCAAPRDGGGVACVDDLERVTRVLRACRRFCSARKGRQRFLEHIPRRNDSRVGRVAREKLASISLLLPRKAGDSVIETKMGRRASIQSGGDACTTTERRAVG